MQGRGLLGPGTEILLGNVCGEGGRRGAVGPTGGCFLGKRSLVYKGGPSKGAEFWGLKEGANGQRDVPVNSEEWVARGRFADQVL